MVQVIQIAYYAVAAGAALFFGGGTILTAVMFVLYLNSHEFLQR